MLFDNPNDMKKKQALHRDLAKAQRVADGKAFNDVLQWLEEREPFDHNREATSLVAFSTGLVSTADDDVNPEKAFDVGLSMQRNIDGEDGNAKMGRNGMIKPLSILRKTSSSAPAQIHAERLFNRLIIFAQRDGSVEEALQYELTPIPLALFNENDQLMNEADKAAFANAHLKTVPEKERNSDRSRHIVVDGGWLLHLVKWPKDATWEEIIDAYVEYIMHLSRDCDGITVVIDGYGKSPKDSTHRRRNKLACAPITLR